MDLVDLRRRPGAPGIAGPDGAGPGGIRRGAADDVDVHLAHHVADAGDVEFFRLEVIGDEDRYFADDGSDLIVAPGTELVQVFDIGFGNDEEPGKNSVVFEQNVTVADESDRVGTGCEPGMEGECHELELENKVKRQLLKTTNFNLSRNGRCQKTACRFSATGSSWVGWGCGMRLC